MADSPRRGRVWGRAGEWGWAVALVVVFFVVQVWEWATGRGEWTEEDDDA